MKKICLIFIMLLFITISYGQTEPQTINSSYKQTNIQTNSSALNTKPEISLTGKILKFDKDEIKIEFQLKNTSSENVYVSTNPRQLRGEYGYYLLLDENDDSKLKISSRVYPRYPGFPYTNEISVELRKLKPGDNYRDNVLVKFPAKETTPAYYGMPLKNKKIIPEKIGEIELSIGYFTEQENIINFLKKKSFGWYVAGENTLSTGETFLEIQKLARMEIQTDLN
jgi:hypothetical protein